MTLAEAITDILCLGGAALIGLAIWMYEPRLVAAWFGILALGVGVWRAR
jgi:hypothetical protein